MLIKMKRKSERRRMKNNINQFYINRYSQRRTAHVLRYGKLLMAISMLLFFFLQYRLLLF